MWEFDKHQKEGTCELSNQVKSGSECVVNEEPIDNKETSET